jgi:hypothetical protein
VLGVFTRKIIMDLSAFHFNGPTSIEQVHICHHKFIIPFFLGKKRLVVGEVVLEFIGLEDQ